MGTQKVDYLLANIRHAQVSLKLKSNKMCWWYESTIGRGPVLSKPSNEVREKEQMEHNESKLTPREANFDGTLRA
jgi:hypothetical protein